MLARRSTLLTAFCMLSAGLLSVSACGDDESVGNNDGGGILTGGSGGGTGTGGTGGGTVSSLGEECSAATDCGPGLTCLMADSTEMDGGGPPFGLCTIDCTEDTGACAEFSSNALCVGFSDTRAFCVESCEFGSIGSGFDMNKCHGRPEFSCQPLLAPTGIGCAADSECPTGSVCDLTGMCLEIVPACMPRCNGDQDCPVDRFCDPNGGVCRDTEASGLALGEACDPDADPDECRGLCVGLVDEDGEVVNSTCTQRCTIGAYPACGSTDPSAATAACLFANGLVSNPGFGDDGFCAKLCDCTDDCSGGDSCVSFGGAVLGREGLCSTPGADDEVLPCMGAGGAGGTVPGAGGAAGSG